MPNKNVDCCVVGGGMIGATLALGLAKQGYSVALIEKDELVPFSPEQAPDIRLSALNMHTVELLSNLGAWKFVQKMRSRAYDTLSVWDGESLKVSGDTVNKKGLTRFTAKEIERPLLGYFVENRLLQLSLYDEINAQVADHVACIHQQSISDIDVEVGRVSLSSGDEIHSKLILGADGAQSQVRTAAGIPSSGWQYAQKANAVLIKTVNKVSDETWQAFYTTGPRALLPMHDNYACLIWYHGAQQSDWIQNAPFEELKASIYKEFPDLIGEFEILQVAGFGLTRMHAHRYGQGKALIAGDAAHTINPLAGQGVNLGFKDAAAILELISEYGLNDTKLLIKQYEAKRRLANLLMMSSMDAIYQTFSSSLLPIKLARQFGLTLADKAGPLKYKALKYAMGLSD